MANGICSVLDCDNPEKAKGWCNRHYLRLWRHGDLDSRRSQAGSENGGWRGNSVSYAGAHSRVYRVRGPACRHRCIGCGEQAVDWSYDYADPDERRSKRGPYSVDPDHYDPRCRQCHKDFDLT